MTNDWLIQDWFPLGHKGQLTGPEGSFKTILKDYLSVCIAANLPILEHPVRQGNVLIVDEETPKKSLESHLDRISQGLGFKSYQDLPNAIEIRSFQGFRFGRKTEIDALLKEISAIRPIFISMDSLTAMLPSGRQRIAENDSNVGEFIRDCLNIILDLCQCSILLLSHTKKPVSEKTIEELETTDIQNLVRGHGSIIGEGCDTGFMIKKITEYPARFAVITKARRLAIPMSRKTLYLQMNEPDGYGKGPITFNEIPFEALPASIYARELFRLFVINGKVEHTSRDILTKYAFYTKKECYWGIQELLEKKLIFNGRQPQFYRLNPEYKSQCHPDYLASLEIKH